VLVCLLMLAATTLIHYEALRWLAEHLALLRLPARVKPLVAVSGCFVAHVLEILVYGTGLWALLQLPGTGQLQGSGTFEDFGTYVFFAAEMYTSIGFGNIEPQGAVRLLVGAMALHGLLLIGWSASYLFIAMERYWNWPPPEKRR
jgi:hypothetical protein